MEPGEHTAACPAEVIPAPRRSALRAVAPTLQRACRFGGAWVAPACYPAGCLPPRRYLAPRDAAPIDDAAAERIDPVEVGLAQDRPVPWRLHAARSWSPLVISFPHVGLAWPAELGDVPPADFARNADFEVHSLYPDANEFGAVCVEAVYSRLLVDLNRAGDDISAVIVPDHPAPRPRRRPGLPFAAGDVDEGDPMRPGRGVVWAQALGHVPLLAGPLRYPEFRARIEHFHEPYHRALEVLLERRRRRFGYAVLLDAHSMPGSVGVDLVLGTLAGTSCAPAIAELALDALGDAPHGPRLRLRLNDPYHGGEVVRRCGRPADGVHALQLELSRGLYMDERTSTLWQPEPEPAGRMTVEVAVPARGAHLAGVAAEGAGHVAHVPRTISGARRGHPAHIAKAHDPSRPPTARHAADFAELRRRVSCLIRALTRGLDTRAVAGTSSTRSRATSAGLGPASR